MNGECRSSNALYMNVEVWMEHMDSSMLICPCTESEKDLTIWKQAIHRATVEYVMRKKVSYAPLVVWLGSKGEIFVSK